MNAKRGRVWEFYDEVYRAPLVVIQCAPEEFERLLKKHILPNVFAELERQGCIGCTQPLLLAVRFFNLLRFAPFLSQPLLIFLWSAYDSLWYSPFGL